MKEFSRFQDLFRTGKETKKYTSQLNRDALKWFKEEFKATFGVVPYSGNTGKFRWAYQGGVLIFHVEGIGSYCYKWVIARLHWKHWRTPAYKQGMAYSLRNLRQGRKKWQADDNPYSENDFVNYGAWYSGFCDGIHLHEKRKANRL